MSDAYDKAKRQYDTLPPHAKDRPTAKALKAMLDLNAELRGEYDGKPIAELLADLTKAIRKRKAKWVAK